MAYGRCRKLYAIEWGEKLMGRRGNKNKNKFQNPFQIQSTEGNEYYLYYARYLSTLAFQLFEWKGLPKTVDPRYLEMTLHLWGFCGFYDHPHLGYIAMQGAPSGRINHYFQPTQFHGVAPMLGDVTFDVYAYNHLKPTGGQGVVIWNNDDRFPTIPDLELFARDLAELKQIIRVNQNAQKTPVLIEVEDDTKLTGENLYNQYAGNALAIMKNKNFDIQDMIKVFKTEAPYVVDKLNTQKNAVWNEAMTYLGINNANLEKRERMINSEAESNNEQIESSGNVFLKARQEACERINTLYPDLNVSVDFREKVLAEHANVNGQTSSQKEGEING